jgi:type IV pilus assembly protein PilM
MSLLPSLKRIFQEPPPDFVFELSEAGIAWARRGRKGFETGFHAIEPGVLSVSPLKDNVLQPEILAAHVAALAPGSANRKRRKAALILPDFCARVAVLDFDTFPSKAEEQLGLVRFRVKKSVPFDIDSALVGYWPQQQPGGKQTDVVVAVTAMEIAARYEAPFRAAGLHPGLVTISSLAMLDLTPRGADAVIARLTGRVLTVLAVVAGRLRLARSVELEAVSAGEISSVLYPTFAFLEDELHSRPSILLTCGLGIIEPELARQVQHELGMIAAPLKTASPVEQYNAGLLGYLASLKAQTEISDREAA